MRTLPEIVGLPAGASAVTIAHAAERHSDDLFIRASSGDNWAQHALVELQFAYRVWAYAKQDVDGVASPERLLAASH